jgi:Peptidase family M28
MSGCRRAGLLNELQSTNARCCEGSFSNTRPIFHSRVAVGGRGNGHATIFLERGERFFGRFPHAVKRIEAIPKTIWKGLIVPVLVLASLGFAFWHAMLWMPLKSYDGPWIPLSTEESALREALRRDVHLIAGDIGDRNVFAYPQLIDTAAWIESSLAQTGYQVRRLGFEARGNSCYNLEAEIRGRTHPEEIVVIGAHYDSVPGCPAANDNGSGVAALLALSRAFAGQQPDRTLRFVAFVNEEPPFFRTSEMGSLVYARECHQRGDRIVAMLSIETIGYYRDESGSQKYPPPFSLFYPAEGNFIAFVGNLGSKSLVRRCLATFRRQVKFPSEGAALPEFITGIGWSDHWSFWTVGYPAVMVTDTAPFRYPYYHSPEDTPEKLDYERMARVVGGLELVVQDLAGSR